MNLKPSRLNMISNDDFSGTKCFDTVQFVTNVISKLTTTILFKQINEMGFGTIYS